MRLEQGLKQVQRLCVLMGSYGKRDRAAGLRIVLAVRRGDEENNRTKREKQMPMIHAGQPAQGVVTLRPSINQPPGRSVMPGSEADASQHLDIAGKILVCR